MAFYCESHAIGPSNLTEPAVRASPARGRHLYLPPGRVEGWSLLEEGPGVLLRLFEMECWKVVEAAE